MKLVALVVALATIFSTNARAGPIVVQSPCPDSPQAAGCYGGGDIIYVKNPRDKQVVWHETGHWVDAHFLNPGEQNKFMRLAHTGPWLEMGRDNFLTRNSGSEQFADAYAHLMLGDTTAGKPVAHGAMRFEWWQSTPYAPNPHLLREINAFILRAMRTEDGLQANQ